MWIEIVAETFCPSQMLLKITTFPYKSHSNIPMKTPRFNAKHTLLNQRGPASRAPYESSVIKRIAIRHVKEVDFMKKAIKH